MRKLIRSALFSPRDAREQRIRMAERGQQPVGEPDDVRDYAHVWDRAAEALHKNDPDGRKMAQLLKVASKSKPARSRRRN